MNCCAEAVLHPPINVNDPLTVSFPFSPDRESLPIVVSPVTLSTENRTLPLGHPLKIENVLFSCTRVVTSLNTSP